MLLVSMIIEMFNNKQNLVPNDQNKRGQCEQMDW